MGKNNRAHHFIPQCYLKNFSSNGKFLWIYDKNNTKIYQQAIDKTCCINDFYTLPKSTDKCIDELFLECEFFAKNVEPQYNFLLKKIIEKYNGWLIPKFKDAILSPEEKYEFANYLTIQWFRTPDARKRNQQLNNSILNQEIEMVKAILAVQNNDPSFYDLNVGYTIDPVIEHAQSSFYDLELIESFARALENNYWEFYVSSKDNILTSDYPIVAEHHIPHVRYTYEGLACYGSELSFPISKNIILVIWDSNYFQDKKKMDCKFSELTDKEINRYNKLRYFYTKRQLISCIYDFSLTEEIN